MKPLPRRALLGAELPSDDEAFTPAGARIAGWVLPADDAARIAGLAAGTASVVELPGIDHVLGWHDSRDASLRDYGAGRFDASIVQATGAWIDRL